MSKENEDNLQKDFPSIKYAYDIAMKSYDWAFQRSDTIDNRINKFLVWVTTITAGIIAIYFSVNKYSSELNVWFYIAIGCYILIFFISAIAEWKTKVDIISPEKLYNNHIEQHEFEFKLDILVYAGCAFKKNLRRIEIKGYLLTTMIAIFLIEMITLIKWLIS